MRSLKLTLLVLLPFLTGCPSRKDTWVTFKEAGVSFDAPFTLEEQTEGSSEPGDAKIAHRDAIYVGRTSKDFVCFELLELTDRHDLTREKLLKVGFEVSKDRFIEGSTVSPGEWEELKISGLPAIVQKLHLEVNGKKLSAQMLIVDAGVRLAIWHVHSSSDKRTDELINRILDTAALDRNANWLVAPQLEEMEEHCAKIRSELAIARPALEAKKKAATAGDIMAAEKINAELQRFNQQAARLTKLEETINKLKTGTPLTIAKPSGNILFQPALLFANGTISQKGKGFLARTASGRIAAISCSHLLDFSGTPPGNTEWRQLSDGRPIARFTETWGTPGDGKTPSTDYWIMPATDHLSPALELDYRKAPFAGEIVWFPLLSDSGKPITWLEGRVAEVKPDRVTVRLDQSVDEDSQSGSPVLSAATGKVIGVFSSEETGGSLVALTPSRIFVEKASASNDPTPLPNSFQRKGTASN